MGLAIIRHEFKMILRSKKNIFFIIALACLLLTYIVFILPTKNTPDTFDAEAVLEEIDQIHAIRQGLIMRGATGYIDFTGQAPYAQFTERGDVLRRLVHAFQAENYERFIQLRMIVPDYLDFEPTPFDRFIGEEALYPGMDMDRRITLTDMRYESYLRADIPLTYEMIEQKTALQTIVNFLASYASILIFAVVIFFSNDMLTKDRRHRSLLQGLPIGWYHLINLKSFVAFFYTGLVLSGFFLLTVGVTTLITGFGSFKLSVPITIPSTQDPDYFGYRFSEFDAMSIAQFLIMAIAMVLLISYLFIRLNALFSLIFRNAWIVLMISLIILFSERIYFSRTFRELFGFELSNFPQTYFDFGRVISGEKYYLLHLESINFGKGMMVLLITIIIIEIAVFLASRIINKRRFFEKSA